MGITGGMACIFLLVVLVALIVLWVVRYGLGPKQPPPADEVGEELPPPDGPTPPQHPRGPH